MLKRLYLLFVMVLPLHLYSITPINILEVGEKEVGVYGSLNVAFNSARGNSELERYSLAGNMQKFNNADIWLLNAYYTIEQSQNVTTANYSYLHLRNVRKLLPSSKKFGRVDWEYFGQIDHNEFQLLDFRGLLGAGLRFKPMKKYHFFLGAGPMFVRETYLDKTESTNYVRANLYLNVKHNITEQTSISYVAYYQPRVDKVNDFDLVQSFKFENDITKNFSLIFLLSYDHDSHPIDSVEKYDFAQTTSFRYKF